MVPLLPLALLVIALAAVGWFAWRDRAEYAAFKQLTDTRDRQARYRRWVAASFLLFVVGSLAILAILGDLGCVIHPPASFFGPMRWARTLAPTDPEFVGALVAGIVVAVVASTVVFTIAARRGALETAPLLGDVQPLMPRNGAETIWTALLSVNAGVGEELFFRLTLPLLLTLVTGNAALAFVAAAIVFGLAHVYQGWVGVLATTVVGVVFTGIYLWAGNLATPMALHAGLDLLSLVVRPTLLRAVQRR